MKYFMFFLVFLVGCAGLSATADIKNLDGKQVGVVNFEPVKEGVHIMAQFHDLPPGEHAIHIHENGSCSDDFKEAEGHFNPTRKEHGVDNPKGPHAGDLPNIVVGKEGTASLDVESEELTLGQGIHSLFKYKGTAIIIHELGDDGVSNPSGNAGARIACGVITR